MEGTHRDTDRCHILAPTTIGVDQRHDLVQDPNLEALMATRSFLDRDVLVGPGRRVVGVDAEEFGPTGVEQVPYGLDHAVVLEADGPSLFRSEHQKGPPVVAVHDQGSRAAQGRSGDLDLHSSGHAVGHTLLSSSVSAGSKASRQAMKLCASATSTIRAG